MRELELQQSGELGQRLRGERRSTLLAQVVAREHELLEGGEAAERRGEVLGHLRPLEAATAQVELLECREVGERGGRQSLQPLLLELVEGDDELLEAPEVCKPGRQDLHAVGAQVAMGEDELLQVCHVREGVLRERLRAVLPKLVAPEAEPLQPRNPPEVRSDHLHGGGGEAAVGEVEVPQLDEARKALGGEDLHEVPGEVVALEVERLHLHEVLEAGDGLRQEGRAQVGALEVQGLEPLGLGCPLLLPEGERPHVLAHGLPLPEVQDLEVGQLRRPGCERLNGGPGQVATPDVEDLQIHEVRERLSAEHRGPLRPEVVALVAEHAQARDVLECWGQLLRGCDGERAIREVELLECAEVGECRGGQRRGTVRAELVPLEEQPL
mmetsp:Transcript_141764/g.440756  ORF Transcript_141764/g.440756 Transcript_141764/m.440756 type:complete len:383 (-) Transcript_141764:349-1497(-)